MTRLRAFALATTVVDKVFAIGTYRSLVGGTMDRLIAGVVNAAGAMPSRQLAALGGVKLADLKASPSTISPSTGNQP